MGVVLIRPAKTEDVQQHRWGAGHLGLAYIAAVLERDGVHVEAIDGKALQLSPMDVADKYQALNGDVVGITAMTHEIHTAHEIAERVKTHKPDATVVIGGPHATALPDRTLSEFPSFDIAVAGEGEKTMLEIVHARGGARFHEDLGEIEGIAYRKNGSVVLNPPRAFMSSEELEDMPFPAWHLFPDQAFPMIAGRGCPFRCKFCMRVLGSKVRMRSPESVADEIDYLHTKFGKKGAAFRDETFGLSKKWTHRFLDLLDAFNEKHGIQWSYRVNSRVNIADRELYERMKHSGCYGVDFGIESGDRSILKQIQKDITLEGARKAIRMAKEAGLKTNTFFIIGHPNETLRTALETIRFAAKLNSDAIAVGVMVPYPGTAIWEMARDGEGGYQLLSEDWRLYDKYFGDAIRLKTLNRNQLKMLQSMCYVWFYLRNFKLKDGWKFVSSHGKEARAMLRILSRTKRSS
jgi:radical SAM superfamily enzyme YgiQ (UPF0313 family)